MISRRSTWYGAANMITIRIHISAKEYQNDEKLGNMEMLVKRFVCPKIQALRRAGRVDRFFPFYYGWKAYYSLSKALPKYFLSKKTSREKTFFFSLCVTFSFLFTFFFGVWHWGFLRFFHPEHGLESGAR